MVTYIIARYQEDVSWADKLDKVVVQKGFDMENVGREPASYFHFIVNNYENLEGEYVFCQGNPFDHAPEILKGKFGVVHFCDGNGVPEHEGLPVDMVLRYLKLPTYSRYGFVAGCQFKASADKIREWPASFYQKCYDICVSDPLVPYVFERIMPIIFD